MSKLHSGQFTLNVTVNKKTGEEKYHLQAEYPPVGGLRGRPGQRRPPQPSSDRRAGHFQRFQPAQDRAVHRRADGRRVRRRPAGPVVLLRRDQPGRPRPHQGHPGHFSTSPDTGVSIPTAFLDQIIGTAILVMVIFALTSAVNNPPLGNTAPLFVDLLVVGIGLGWGANAGYAINPARDFGPPGGVLADWLPRGHVLGQQPGTVFLAAVGGTAGGGVIGGALFVFGIERFLPAAISEPAEIGVVEPTPSR